MVINQRRTFESSPCFLRKPINVSYKRFWSFQFAVNPNTIMALSFHHILRTSLYILLKFCRVTLWSHMLHVFLSLEAGTTCPLLHTHMWHVSQVHEQPVFAKASPSHLNFLLTPYQSSFELTIHNHLCHIRFENSSGTSYPIDAASHCIAIELCRVRRKILGSLIIWWTAKHLRLIKLAMTFPQQCLFGHD